MTADSSSYSLQALERRWQLDKTPQVGLRLAEEYRRKGDLSASIEVLAAALEVHPTHTASRVALGRDLVDGKRYEEAVPHLEEIVRPDPTHLVANKLLVEAYAGIGRLGDARDKLDIYQMMGEGDADIERLRALIEAGERMGAAPPAEPTPSGGLEVAEEPLADTRREELGVATAADNEVDHETEPTGDSEVSEALDQTVAGEPFGSAWTAAGSSDYWQEVADEGIFALDGNKGAKPEGTRGEEPVTSNTLEEPSQDAETSSTVTMGRLYLEQGHREEAVAVFQDVLTREPGNETARQGLEAADEAATADILERRKAALVAYRSQLRRAVEAGI